MEINKSLNFAHVTRLPSKHIHDTEKEYSRSFACNVLHVHHVFIPQYLYSFVLPVELYFVESTHDHSIRRVQKGTETL